MSAPVTAFTAPTAAHERHISASASCSGGSVAECISHVRLPISAPAPFGGILSSGDLLMTRRHPTSRSSDARPNATYFLVIDRRTSVCSYTWRAGTRSTSFYVSPRFTPLAAFKISLHGPDPRHPRPGFKVAIDQRALTRATEAGGVVVTPDRRGRISAVVWGLPGRTTRPPCGSYPQRVGHVPAGGPIRSCPTRDQSERPGCCCPTAAYAGRRRRRPVCLH